MARYVSRRDVLGGIAAGGLAGLAGCVGDLAGAGGRQVKYGVLLPLTGDLGPVGTPMRDAAILPAKQLSDADLGGLSIDYQVEDTQTDPSQAVSGANALVNAGYPAVCGPAASDANIQTANQVFVPNEVVNCSPSSTSPAVTDLEDEDYNWRTAPSDALQGTVMARVASERANADTAATMFVNNDYGQALSEQFVGGFEKRGGTVQKQVAFAKQQSSYTAKLESALATDPDALVVIGYPTSGTQLFKDYYADFDAARPVVVPDGLQSQDMLNQVGRPMENVIGTAPKPAGPNVDDFNSLYRDEYGTGPSIFTAHTYDAAAVLVLANAAGGNDGAAIRDQMQTVANPQGTPIGPSDLAEGVRMVAEGEDVNYAGASSSVNFDSNGDMKAVAYSIWNFDPDADGGIEVVDTIDFGS